MIEYLITIIPVVAFLGVLVVLLSLPLMVKRILLALRQDEFECLMCGNCCRFRTIDMSSKDVERIEAAGKKDFYEKFEGAFRLKRKNGRCVFVEDDKCTIHEIKPKVCREFPFFKLYGCIPYIHDWSCCPGVEKMKNKKN
ncbi:YkgJ family cysteine cluster protein [Candidatus Altiarchaeota archaeon]